MIPHSHTHKPTANIFNLICGDFCHDDGVLKLIWNIDEMRFEPIMWKVHDYLSIINGKFDYMYADDRTGLLDTIYWVPS